MRANEFVQSYFDAWNHQDAEGVAAHLVTNGTYIDIPEHQQLSKEKLVAYLAQVFDHQKAQYNVIGEILASENSIAFQYRMSPSDSAGVDWFGAEFMTLEGDGAVKIADYYDPTHTVHSNLAEAHSAALPKYAKSGLHLQQLAKYLETLTTLMEQEKVFLEPGLTLPKLARMVNCSVNHLSQAVNAGFGLNFFDFLNSYRICEAKALLSHSDLQSNAILDVAFAVGFNSNSAFYSAFKKITGLTPAQFRRDALDRS
jgi:AraC-like DNA-binding protein